MTGYYDYVLGAIPVALLGITTVLTVFGFSLTTALPLGATVSMGFIGHAMFVRAPTDSSIPQSTPSTTAAETTHDTAGAAPGSTGAAPGPGAD